MGIEVALAVAAVSAVAGTATSIVSGNQARASARHAADLQDQAQSDQAAQNAQDAAQASRQQYRENRIKQARILQSSSNSGTEGSSGEIGSIGSLSTQYSSNQGTLNGNYDRGVQIGQLNQGAANSIFQAQQSQQSGAELSSIFGTVGKLGMAYAGATSKALPGTTPQPGQAGYDASNGFDNPSNYG